MGFANDSVLKNINLLILPLWFYCPRKFLIKIIILQTVEKQNRLPQKKTSGFVAEAEKRILISDWATVYVNL